MKKNQIPNLITLLRLLACLPLVVLFSQKHYLSVLILYALQELLDQVDGKLALAFRWQSTTGKFFDPFVDSLTHLLAFACLLSVSILPLWMYGVFLFRELGLLFLRLLASLQGIQLGGHWPGKIKALIHAIAIFACFWELGVGGKLIASSSTWLFCALAASLFSGIFYLTKYRSILRNSFFL